MDVKMEKVLVPTDFSAHSECAFRSALNLKREFGSEIIALHVFDVSEMLGLGWTVYGESLEAEVVSRMEGDSRKAMDRFIEKMGAKGDGVKTVIARGRPFVEIVRAARDEKVDLILMGTHGRKGVEHLIMGSNAEKVVRKAPCSVMTVKHIEGHKEQTLPAKTILVPTDFSLTSERAMSMATKLALKYSSRIVVLHVFADLKVQEAVQWTEYLPTGRTEAELEEGIMKRAREELEAFASKFPLSGLNVDLRTRSDLPFRGVIEEAVESKADLIVMGTHGRSGLNYLLMGSTAEKVVRQAPCPVLTVKPGEHSFELP